MRAQFDHERLKAYQKALEFVSFAGPIIDELSGKLSAKDQLDRASTSVVLNLAEGNGKRSQPERCRYFDIARGLGGPHAVHEDQAPYGEGSIAEGEKD
jgi:hypothetical protein